MSAALSREAARLRACRLAFERAQRDGVTVMEARWRNVRDAWAAAHAGLARLRCGTAAPVVEETEDRPAQWWQRD